MNALLAFALTFAAALGAYCYWELPQPWNFAAAPVLLLLAFVSLAEPKRRVRIGGMTWTPAEVCQHFFITGATGTAKTQSAVNTLAASFVATFPRCSAVFLDVKGVVHADVAALSKWASRQNDYILLKSRSHKDPRNGGQCTQSISPGMRISPAPPTLN
jgi:hypothetical protein